MELPYSLIEQSILSNNLNWCSLVFNSPGEYHNRMSAEASTKLKSDINEFVSLNSEHPLSNVVVPPKNNVEHYIRHLENSRRQLLSHYLKLKKTAAPADDAYFELFDLVINDTKNYLDVMGIDHRDLHYLSGDHLLCNRATIQKIVSGMVDVSINTLKQNVTKFDNIPERHLSIIQPEIVDFINYYEDRVTMVSSDRNGSFMIPSTPNSARVHIKNKDSDIEKVGSVFHEYGHALYQTDILSQTYAGQLGLHLSISLHETSSIFTEIALGGMDLHIIVDNPKNLFRLGSDKLHYIIHLFIRMVIEDELFSGEITARDIPSRWNEMMLEYTGMTPSNDWEGFLQDIHWNDGSFGYFHSYAIGFFNAIHLLDKVKHRLSTFGTDFVLAMNTVILPTIRETYGHFTDSDTDLLLKIHPDIDASMKQYRDFITTNFKRVTL